MAGACAFTTLVMRSESYACGALVLGHSLRAGGSEACLICMVTDDIADDVRGALAAVWHYVVEVPKITAARGVRQMKQTRFGHMYDSWLQWCLTKCTIFTFEQYAKVAFLDADMLCVGPPDTIFAYPTPVGICDTYRFAPEMDAAMDGRKVPFADIEASLRNRYAIRGCLLVVAPDRRIYDEICQLAARQAIGHSGAVAGPDEYFLTKYFHDRRIPWTHIHSRYGTISWAVERALGSIPPVFLHYVSEKPWEGPRSTACPLGVTGNWKDFLRWDEPAAAVQAAIAQDHADVAGRLFAGWRERRKLPVQVGLGGQ